MGSGLVRPLTAEQLHPFRPQLLIVKVGTEAVPHLTDVYMRMKIGDPAGTQVTGRSVTDLRTVDENDELITALGSPVDHERMTEVRRIETADDQTVLPDAFSHGCVGFH